MATSGSIDFNLDRNTIVSEALKELGVIEAGETPSAEDADDGNRALNRMVKAWIGNGTNLWKKVEGVLYLTVGTVQYGIGSAGDHCTTEADAVKTEIATAAVLGASTVEVDSITGIAASDNIGVEQDDGTLHWTTVNGAPTGTTVTLTDVLTAAAAVDNHVYAYTSKIDRPLKVLDARRRDEADQDIPVIMFSREEYMQTPNKTTQSLPVQVYYDPQLTTGQMYLWPAPADVQNRLHFTAYIPLQDFDASTDNPDFPQEWLDALVFGLARRLCGRYGVPLEDRVWIKNMADETLGIAKGWDAEATGVFFGVDYT